MTRCLVSIIIINFNYGRFLRQAIDSALDQTYRPVEVVVVDDGSTDCSREIMRSYGDQIVSVLKKNGGQGSAFNFGFAKTSGEIACFLDSDDALLPDAIERIIALFDPPDIVKVHWPLWIIDSAGARTGRVKEPELPEGDFREIVYREGPMTEATLPSAPTSGNAYRRTFLGRVLPMPESAYRVAADAYLFGLAPAFGIIRRSEEPLGLYRRHSSNTSSVTPFLEKVARGVEDFRVQRDVLRKLLIDEFPALDSARWGEKAWWMMIHNSLEDIQAHVPEGATFILADGDNWGTDAGLLGRKRLLFNERHGCYWGIPEDDAAAIQELDRLCQHGAAFLVIAWPIHWWRDYFPVFFSHIEQFSRCILRNERISIHDLRSR
jgi:glycosyltransferase involved in cell wall biosynthesis